MKKLIIILLLFSAFCSKAQYQPVVLQNQSGIVLRNLVVPSISLTYCTNVRIINCWIGPSTICGVQTYNCTEITIDSCHFQYVATGVEAISSKQIVVSNCTAKNMIGPFPKGEFVQFNNVTDAGNKVINNKFMNQPGLSLPTDGISIYESSGTAASPILIDGNEIEGGNYPTGCGITLGDSGGSYQTASNNIVVNPGSVGIDITAGDHMSLVNNKVYGQQNTWTNVGLYVWAQKGAAVKLQPITNSTVSGNRVYWINSKGQASPNWLAPGEQTPTGWNTNVWQDGTLNANILSSVP